MKIVINGIVILEDKEEIHINTTRPISIYRQSDGSLLFDERINDSFYKKNKIIESYNGIEGMIFI
jgi:hypothetical protein